MLAFNCPISGELQHLKCYTAIQRAGTAGWPLEDAYEAALYMLGNPIMWTSTPDPERRAYRGQRKDVWPLQPKIYRDPGSEQQNAMRHR
jgi:hypothetical protein